MKLHIFVYENALKHFVTGIFKGNWLNTKAADTRISMLSAAIILDT